MPTTEKEAILGQIAIAFGRGCSSHRVPRKTVASLRDWCEDWVDSVSDRWEEQGVQYLARFEAVGRLAGAEATAQGQTTIEPANLQAAVGSVMQASATRDCPPDRI